MYAFHPYRGLWVITDIQTTRNLQEKKVNAINRSPAIHALHPKLDLSVESQ
jgi:hypothetical protein